MTATDVMKFNNYLFTRKDRVLKTDYENELELMKFKSRSYDTFVGKHDELNELVEKDTDGMIKELFKEDELKRKLKEKAQREKLYKAIKTNTDFLKKRVDNTKEKEKEKFEAVRET